MLAAWKNSRHVALRRKSPLSILGEIVRRLASAPDILRAVARGSEKVDRIDVYGRREFRRAVRTALLLLRDTKLPAWDTLTRHVGSIVEGSTTETVVGAHPAIMVVSGPHSVQEPKFLAAMIAFMACGIQLHRSYESGFPGRRVPRDVYFSGSAMQRCEKARHECLLALWKGANGDA
jgi:hypothetical protein